MLTKIIKENKSRKYFNHKNHDNVYFAYRQIGPKILAIFKHYKALFILQDI